MSKHNHFTANTKMADIILNNYLLLPIIGRFGIDLGFGNKTVSEVCAEKSINTFFFLEIINSYNNPEYFTAEELQEYPLMLIIEYLTNTHNYYRKVKIPELEKMVYEIIKNSNPDNKKNNLLIANFFEEYKTELIKHLENEEKTIFPFTIELENTLHNHESLELLIQKIAQSKSAHNNDDHDQLEAKLLDLKNLIIKFLPPVKRKDLIEKLLIELFRLEEDLNDHSRIEDHVLLPKINKLELQFQKR
ncbi:MAG TPA: hypothetical protein PLF35_02355 [Prolixibacteraceae bacterium]|nr:hypothetical protein [Prolixibacteraceae bacterium]